MPASVGQIVSMLQHAEKDLAAVRAQGLAAAAVLVEANTPIKAAGQGVPNPNIAIDLDRLKPQLEAAFNDVMQIVPALRDAATEIQAAFGRRR